MRYSADASRPRRIFSGSSLSIRFIIGRITGSSCRIGP